MHTPSIGRGLAVLGASCLALATGADAEHYEIRASGTLDFVLNPEMYPGDYDGISEGDTFDIMFAWDPATQETQDIAPGQATHSNAVTGFAGLTRPSATVPYATSTYPEAHISVIDAPSGSTEGGDSIFFSFFDNTLEQDINFSATFGGPPDTFSSTSVPVGIGFEDFTSGSFVIHTYGGVATGFMHSLEIRVVPAPSAVGALGIAGLAGVRRARRGAPQPAALES